jgi:hypothetical protein
VFDRVRGPHYQKLVSHCSLATEISVLDADGSTKYGILDQYVVADAYLKNANSNFDEAVNILVERSGVRNTNGSRNMIWVILGSESRSTQKKLLT